MKKSRTPTSVTTAVLTLITVIFWAGFEIYRTLTIKPEPPVPQPIIRPLDPTLDIKTLQSIGQRTFLSDDQIGNTQPTVTLAPTATPAVTTTPLATASATPIATSSASPVPTKTP